VTGGAPLAGGTTRVIAAPGVRSDSGRGWRAVGNAVVGLVTRDPGLWLLGALAFAARGGIVALALPILTIPSPVMLSIIFRGDISTTGVSADAQLQELIVTIAAGVLLIASLFLAAYADVASFARMVGHPATAALRSGRGPRDVPARERRNLLFRLAAIEAAGLLPVLIVIVEVGARISQVVVSELQFPSDLQNSLIVNVLTRVQSEVILLIVVVLAADVLVTLAARQVLAARFEVLPNALVLPADAARPHHDMRQVLAGLSRAIVQLPRTLFLAAICWAITALAVVPVIMGTLSAWLAVRYALFAPGPGQGGPDDATRIAVQLLFIVLFGAIWVGGITLVGIASSVRAALWTVNVLRP
jgi:hypothetical protein